MVLDTRPETKYKCLDVLCGNVAIRMSALDSSHTEIDSGGGNLKYFALLHVKFRNIRFLRVDVSDIN